MPRPGGPPTLPLAGGAEWRPGLVVAIADPATLPDKATGSLVTNLPRPGAPQRPAARTRRPTWPNRAPG